VKNSGNWLRTIANALRGSDAVFLLRVVGSLSGLAAILVEWWGPAGPSAQLVVQWATTIAVILVFLSFVIQVAQKLINLDWALYRMVAEKYGYGYEKLQVLAYLEEESKKMRVHRHVRVKATMPQRSVRHYLHDLSNSVDDQIKVGGFNDIDSPGVDLSVEKVEELSIDDKMVVEVTFDPFLDAGRSAEYELKEVFPPGSFAINADAMKSMKLEFEFLSWHLSRPTRQFEYVVRISKSLNPDICSYDVWYDAKGRQRHLQEYRRLESLFDQDPNADPDYVSLILRVPYPVVGLVYVIKWKYK
jgi:hypothetical protein